MAKFSTEKSKQNATRKSQKANGGSLMKVAVLATLMMSNQVQAVRIPAPDSHLAQSQQSLLSDSVISAQNISAENKARKSGDVADLTTSLDTVLNIDVDEEEPVVTDDVADDKSTEESQEADDQT